MDHPTALEQSFLDICDQHDLTNFSVTRYHTATGQPFWGAAAHWDGYSNSGRGCVGEHSYSSLREAITKTLTKAAARRTASIIGCTLADEALPIVEAA